MKNLKNLSVVLAILAVMLTGVNATPQQSSSSDQNHHNHQSDIDKRGNKAMGFDQDKTTHHFYLMSDGGIIQVEANDRDDNTSRDQIRMHLHHISQMFSEGNFEIPMFVHDQVPPGVPEMKRLKDALVYSYEETENGARVIISTKSEAAAKAVHDFLRFQILEHHTGDSLEVRTRYQ